MPVHLEWLEQPTEQDLLDLNKLYQESPFDWLASAGIQAGQANIGARYLAFNRQKGHLIVAGRFNDRLICVCRLTPQQDQPWQVSQLLVRSVTQGRGVAKQLLVRLCQWADELGHDLSIDADDEGKMALDGLNFTYTQGKWLYRQRN